SSSRSAGCVPAALVPPGKQGGNWDPAGRPASTLDDRSVLRPGRKQMHYNFAVKWLKAFRQSPESVCKLYDDQGFIFEDVMLDQHNIDNKPDFLRLFAPYANKDTE